MKTTIITTTILFSLFAGIASAQSRSTLGVNQAADPAISPPVSYSHASTFEEGLMRGGADFMRSIGEMNYNHSLAAINGQQARSMYLDNNNKAIATYFEGRKLNRDYRAAEMGPRPTAEEYARYAKEAAPKRLSVSQFEPALGMIFWPALLQNEVFAPERKEIDRLFGQRSAQDGLGSSNCREIQRVAAELAAKLRNAMGDLSAQEYIAAKKFIVSLDYESQFANKPLGLAVR